MKYEANNIELQQPKPFSSERNAVKRLRQFCMTFMFHMIATDQSEVELSERKWRNRTLRARMKFLFRLSCSHDVEWSSTHSCHYQSLTRQILAVQISVNKINYRLFAKVIYCKIKCGF